MEKIEFTLDNALTIFKAEMHFDKDGKLTGDPASTIAYLSKYFYPTLTGFYYFWDAKKEEFEYYDKQSIKTVFFDKLPDIIRKWFFHTNTKLYNVVCDFKAPRLEGNNINLFVGIKHPVKAFATYSKEIKQKVNLFLQFVKDVICNGSDDAFEFITKWCSVVVKTGKNDACIYLKGPKRIGKNTFTDMLRTYVLGESISLSQTNTEPLTTSYNKILCGKLLVVFEELPVFSTREWNAVSSKLKQMITGSSLIYRDLYEKSFPASNGNNYIINSNDEAIKHSEDDRYFICPVSTKRKGDKKYWTMLYDECYNNEVGEALYNYFLEIDTKNFRAQRDMPLTQNKCDAIAERLEQEYRFLKDKYILKKKDLKISLKDLYKQYDLYCYEHEKKALTKIKFNKKLEEIGIKHKTSTGQFVYRVPLSELQEIAKTNNWIHEFDLDELNKVKDDDNDEIDEETEKKVIEKYDDGYLFDDDKIVEPKKKPVCDSLLKVTRNTVRTESNRRVMTAEDNTKFDSCDEVDALDDLVDALPHECECHKKFKNYDEMVKHFNTECKCKKPIVYSYRCRECQNDKIKNKAEFEIHIKTQKHIENSQKFWSGYNGDRD